MHQDQAPLQQANYFKNIPTTYKVNKISDIDQNHKIVLFKGTVIRTGMYTQQLCRLKSITKWVDYKCVQCGRLQRVYADATNYFLLEQPNKCEQQVVKQVKYHPFFKTKDPKFKKGSCNSKQFEKTEQAALTDYQEIKIQDTYTTLKPGTISNSIRVMLEGEHANECHAGDDVIVGGLVIQRWKMVKQKPNITLWVECKYLKSKEQEQPIPMTMEFPSNPIQFRNQLIESFHPQLCHMWEIKLAMLLCLIGGVSQYKNGTQIRGSSHFLLIGEPGTGKSQLLRQACKISSRGIYVNGIGVSQAGLTVSYSKDGADWMVEAGALVMADQGVCCIDEFNLIPQQCQQSVLEALEQQTISSSKAGISTKLNARTTILAACSPVGQSYNNLLDLNQNSGLSYPLLSRFDVIFILRDQHDLILDRQLCEHLLLFNRKNNLSVVEIQQYIQFIKVNYNPTLDDIDLQRAIQKYFGMLRQTQENVTARKLESLIRLCEAHARLCQRDQVDKFDVVTIIALNECTQTTGVYRDFMEVLQNDVNVDSINRMWDAIA